MHTGAADTDHAAAAVAFERGPAAQLFEVAKTSSKRRLCSIMGWCRWGGAQGKRGWRKGAGVCLPYPTGQFFGISPHIAKRLFFVHLWLFKAAFFI